MSVQACLFTNNPPFSFVLGRQVSHLESIDDIVQGVASSNQRNFILLVLLSVVGVIFAVGMLCGRTTRRYMLLKNR